MSIDEYEYRLDSREFMPAEDSSVDAGSRLRHVDLRGIGKNTLG